MKFLILISLLSSYTAIYSDECYDVDFLNDDLGIVNLFHKQMIKEFRKTFKFKMKDIKGAGNNKIDTVRLSGYKIKDPQFKVSYTSIIQNGTCTEYLIEWIDKMNASAFDFLSKYPCWKKIKETGSKYYTIENKLIKVADVYITQDTARYTFRYYNGELNDLLK
ncbi:MAG: hypothetical protein JWN78_3370 [Bacteroidota bacterium]|nr:hypothetical protein [Bacteroidota bacterium]